MNDTKEFDSEFCNVKYMEKDKVVLLTWKKFAQSEDYRRPTRYALDLLKEYPHSNLVVDARDGFEDAKEDVEWGFKELLPNMAKTDCSYVAFILQKAPEIEEEMDMWTKEFSKYFTVTKSESYEQAIQSISNCQTSVVIAMDRELKELNINNIDEIKEFFFDIFTKDPWNDDWSDEKQLHCYIVDLIGNQNSLVLGLFENGSMVGLSMGNIRHWYSGTQYNIDELCIKTEEQGRGLGSQFLKEIEIFIKNRGIIHIFLQTERTVPAYQFYKKNGFYELEEHVSFVKKCEV